MPRIVNNPGCETCRGKLYCLAVPTHTIILYITCRCGTVNQILTTKSVCSIRTSYYHCGSCGSLIPTIGKGSLGEWKEFLNGESPGACAFL